MVKKNRKKDLATPDTPDLHTCLNIVNRSVQFDIYATPGNRPLAIHEGRSLNSKRKQVINEELGVKPLAWRPKSKH